MKYRKEIDGLRAFAVLPVLFYHAGTGIFPGGFLGVDIFFVISGYLITTILAAELAEQRYSLINFYERRARRILPALMAMLVLTTIASLVFLGPEELQSYSQSVVSVVAFSSNIFFYLTSGYFATASEEQLLLHTWSLAVEEQYYVFFPILLWILWAYKRHLLSILLLLSIASFVLSLYLSGRDPSANFYLITSRAWELFAGSLLAFYYQRSNALSSPYKALMAGVGLIMVLFSLVFIDKHALHPGWPTLLPVLGTCLIIAFANGTHIAKLLSFQPFVWVGLISYSLYLWHQPIYALLRAKFVTEPAAHFFALATLAAFALAWFSYRYVEKPFRNKTFLSQKGIFAYSLAALGLFAAFGISGHFANGWQQRFDSSLSVVTSHSPVRYACHANLGNKIAPDNACNFGHPQPAWVVLGDSHGVELSYALSLELANLDQGVAEFTYSACPPAFDYATPIKGCAAWLRQSLDYINATPAISHVLLAFRHTAHLFGQVSIEQMQDFRTLKVIDNEQKYSPEQLREIYWASFESLIQSLLAQQKNVVLLLPVPELPTHVNKLMVPTSIFSKQLDVDKTRTELDNYWQRNRYAIDRLKDLQEKYHLQVVDPTQALCDKDYCYALRDNLAMYFDNNHLSVAGATRVIQKSGMLGK